MDASFWHQKWETNTIGFHQSKTNPLLVKYLNTLPLRRGSRIFIPLCGKTLDIAWLLSIGYTIAGAELSELAVEQLFMELGVEPNISNMGKLHRYSAKNIDIFVGDIFHLSNEIIGPISAVYDRAALVALPKEIRNRYSAHLMQITNQAPQLLITFEYDQQSMEGPPFSISKAEIDQHYGDCYHVTLLESSNVLGGLKGRCAAKEHIWILKNEVV